ncbi:hypothetical protein DR64_7929 [Paraburkholderia xenovorans LB400]|nr:hypothetical protein DR64_7929 [Paraburkholderia xenovorans LB400]
MKRCGSDGSDLHIALVCHNRLLASATTTLTFSSSTRYFNFQRRALLGAEEVAHESGR